MERRSNERSHADRRSRDHRTRASECGAMIACVRSAIDAVAASESIAKHLHRRARTCSLSTFRRGDAYAARAIDLPFDTTLHFAFDRNSTRVLDLFRLYCGTDRWP